MTKQDRKKHAPVTDGFTVGNVLLGRSGQIFRHAWAGSVVALLFGLLLLLVYWEQWGVWLGLLWLAVLVTVMSARVAVMTRLKVEHLTAGQHLFWRLLYPVGLNFNGLWFGLGMAWLVWVTDAHEQQLIWLVTFVVAALTVSMFGVIKLHLIAAPLLGILAPVTVAVIKQQPGWQNLLVFSTLFSVIMLGLFILKSRFFYGIVEGQQLLLAERDQRIDAQARFASAEQELSQLLRNLRDLIYQFDQNGIIVNVSPSCERLLGYKESELRGEHFSKVIQRPEVVNDMVDAMVEKGFVDDYLHPVTHKDGHELWFSATAILRRSEDSGQFWVEGASRDVTESRKTKLALANSETKAVSTLGAISDAVVTVSPYGTVEYMNQVAGELTGWDPDQAVGEQFETVLELLEERSGQRSADPIKRCLRDGVPVNLVGELLVINQSDGSNRKVHVTASPIRDNLQEISGVVIALHDVTKVESLTRELSYQATHDKLTGLINRSEFEVRLADALNASQSTGVEHSMLYMDLDQFKIVNDTCGHTAGDALLKQLSNTLQTAVRESDTLARLGGDEFGLLLDSCTLSNAIRTANKVLEAVQAIDFSWEGRQFEIGASIGAVAVNSDSGDLTEVLRMADSACYVAKDMGRGRVHAYSIDDEHVSQRIGQAARVTQIQHALSTEGFSLATQQIKPINPDFSERTGTEFLIRLRDQAGHYEAATEFLPAAERYHLMPRIDRWVIHQAFSRIARRSGPLRSCSEYAINLSGQSLSDQGLLAFIQSEQRAFGIQPESICFEITETAVVANIDRASELIKALRAEGFKIALDDFGSGLSSFQYLKRLEVDKLKIDGAFVQDVANDAIDEAMVRAIVQVAHQMRIETVAEYVADDESLECLKAIGVDFAQGFHIAKPELLAAVGEEE